MATDAYTSSVEPVDYFGMHSGRIGTGFRGIVVRADTNTVVWGSSIYEERRTALLQANRMKPRYQHHLDTHGVGFEEHHAAQKVAKEAARKARRDYLNRLNAGSEALLDAAKAILAENSEDSRETLRFIIAKIEG